MKADGSAQVRLTDSPALDALPSFSPNGKLIVFVSDRTAKDNREFFQMTATGGSQRRLFADPRAVGHVARLGRVAAASAAARSPARSTPTSSSERAAGT